jgi:hypothetical protein
VVIKIKPSRAIDPGRLQTSYALEGTVRAQTVKDSSRGALHLDAKNFFDA